MFNYDLFLLLGSLALWYCLWSFLFSSKPSNSIKSIEEHSLPKTESVEFVLTPEALERLSGFVSFSDNLSLKEITASNKLNEHRDNNVIIFSNYKKIKDLSNV